MSESIADNNHCYWDDCEDCGKPVAVMVDSLEDRGEIEVLCYDCAFYEDDGEPA
jgi:hypothetical protein